MVKDTVKYYPALDGLRALIVLIVFTDHYYGWRLQFFYWGWIGVDISFVLSGFLITGILYDSRRAPRALRNFYVRRALRVFPLFYAVWLTLLLMAPLVSWNWSIVWLLWPLQLGNYARFVAFDPHHLYHADVLRNIGHLKTSLPFVYIGHFWSLAIEEQFYLVWPLVVLRARSTKQLIITCVILLLSIGCLRGGLILIMPDVLFRADFVNRFTPIRADAQIMGALLALLLRSSAKQWLSKNRRAITASSSLLFLILACRKSWDPVGHLSEWIRYTTTPLFVAAIIHECTHRDSVVARALSWMVLRRLGIVSYGFYVLHDLPHSLYHVVALNLPYLRRVPELGTALVAFPSTLILSVLSWRYIESPILRQKRRWSNARDLNKEKALELG